jgi:glutamate synthase domain-containing protein 3
MKRAKIDAKSLCYRDLNDQIHDAVRRGAKEIILRNVNGQRYIGDGVRGNIKIQIDGVPGNDLAAFMDGPTIVVNSNAQDVVANTMNEGKVVIHGHAGDVLGYGMRGGKLFVRGDVGYRVGIHMKAFKKHIPVIVIGGTARDFLGEYQAGGVIVLLGLERDGLGSKASATEHKPLAGNYIGTGMHGGVIYIRGEVDPFQLGKEVSISSIDEKDSEKLKLCLREYCDDLGLSIDDVMRDRFIKLLPTHLRPYGKIYAY